SRAALSERYRHPDRSADHRGGPRPGRGRGPPDHQALHPALPAAEELSPAEGASPALHIGADPLDSSARYARAADTPGVTAGASTRARRRSVTCAPYFPILLLRSDLFERAACDVRSDPIHRVERPQRCETPDRTNAVTTNGVGRNAVPGTVRRHRMDAEVPSWPTKMNSRN